LDPAHLPRTRLADRWLAVACAAFLVWRAGAALHRFAGEITIPLGTHRQALVWSEAERIDALFARLDRGQGFPDGYMQELYRALLRLPPETRAWTALAPADPRFRISIWLNPLIYPRTLTRVPVGGNPRPTEGAAILAFESAPLPGSEHFERVAAGPDWALWR
jgi:hypothetical protein